jgi:hypothetical protein
MKSEAIRKGSVWVLCLFVLGGLVYSIGVLTAQPAYADSVCEPEDCAQLAQYILPAVCQSHRGVEEVLCPDSPTYPNNFSFVCNDGFSGGGDCTNL